MPQHTEISSLVPLQHKLPGRCVICFCMMCGDLALCTTHPPCPSFLLSNLPPHFSKTILLLLKNAIWTSLLHKHALLLRNYKR